MAARSKSQPAVDLDAIVAHACAEVRSKGMLKLSALRIPKPRMAEVLDRLSASGLELTKTIVRRPLEQQMTEQLATGAFLPLSTLAKQLCGATRLEAQKLALRLASERKAAIVLRAGKEVLVPADADCLAGQELAGLARALEAAAKAAKSAARKGRGVLRGDLAEPLGRFLTARVEPKVPHGVDLSTAVLRACGEHVDARLGLAFVPKVVRALALQSDTESARKAILQAFRAGLIELRPESGMGRLSAEEESLCLPGPQGTLLSWIRLVEGGP